MSQASASRATDDAMNALKKALKIKADQERALKSLESNALFIALWVRSDPPLQNDFHWGYYFHNSPSGGNKYHMTNMGNGWIADHGKTSGVFKSTFLCVLIRIATVPPAKFKQLEKVMKSRDKDVNSIPGVTCRVWLMTILKKLIEVGIVRCENAQALQQECMDFGNRFRSGAAANIQPRPVVRSNLCS